MTRARKGQYTGTLSREAFHERFLARFSHPAYEVVAEAMAKVEQVAWDNYIQYRKTAHTDPAGPGYADPSYALSREWRQASERLKQAQQRQQDPSTPSRVLVIIGADRNDGTCPGEISKSFRLAGLAREVLEQAKVEVDLLDLSMLASDYDRHIHPCKGCVSTAMPLCHWPCSCYPNHAMGQVNDWMNEIYEKWVSAHGVIIVTPVYWYQSPSALKLMIDRLVCADGGNPDPTLTGGKNVEKAKAVELAGWSYPKHLAGRAYGMLVHGDVAGIDGTRRALSDWLDWMGLVDAGMLARIERYIGYYRPYATSHEELDRDLPVQEEMRNVARAMARAVARVRDGTLATADSQIEPARRK